MLRAKCSADSQRPKNLPGSESTHGISDGRRLTNCPMEWDVVGEVVMVVSQVLSALTAFLIGLSLIAAVRTTLTIASQSLRLLLFVGFSLLLANSAFPGETREYGKRLPFDLSVLLGQLDRVTASVSQSFFGQSSLGQTLSGQSSQNRESADRPRSALNSVR